MKTVYKVAMGTGCVALFLGLAVFTANAVSTWTVVKQGQFGVYCDKNLSTWPNLCSPKHTFTSTISGNSAVKLAYTVAAGHCASVRAHVLVDGVEKGVTAYMGHYGTLPSASRPKTYTVELGTIQSGSHEFSLMGELDGLDCSGGNAGLANWGGDFVLSAEQISATTPISGTIACTNNNDCQATTYGNNYCSANTTIYRSKTSFICMNQGQASSYCQPNTIQEFQFSCYGNQTCQSGSCVANYTNAYNHHSYQQCYNNAVWWYDSNNSRQDVAQYCNSNQYCSGNTCINQTIYYPPYNPPVYTNPVYGNAQVTVQVRNLSSGNLNWSSSVVASPSDIVQYNITIKNNSSQSISNLTVRDILPANLYFYNNVMVDSIANSGSIASGINIGPLSANQTRIVMYQAQVAPAQNFNFGTTTLTNGVTLTSTDSGFNNPGVSSASVVVTRSGVLGATSVSTGPLTGNSLVDSFLLPLILALLGVWLYASGILPTFGIPEWVGSRKSKNHELSAKTKLEGKVLEIRSKGNS